MPNTNKMPYFWRMYMLERFHTGYFFSPGAKKFFSSRVQTAPPYCGRVFVTSEKFDWNSPRLYTVRCIRPDGGIDTIEGFQAFTSRQSAHAYAKAYAAEQFERVGEESVSKT